MCATERRQFRVAYYTHLVATLLPRRGSFAITAAAGADGLRTVNVAASVDPGCSTTDATTSLLYTIDNTAPLVSATTSPASGNLAGWFNTDVTITWSASDAGSGVASGPTPATDSQTTNTPGAIHTSTATDRVGNVGNGRIVIALDKTPPSISGVRTPAANANGWNNTNVTVQLRLLRLTLRHQDVHGTDELHRQRDRPGRDRNGIGFRQQYVYDERHGQRGQERAHDQWRAGRHSPTARAGSTPTWS